jgi:hypothetical protein
MSEGKYLVPTSLLDSKQRVNGYKLAWQKKENDCSTPGEEELNQLLTFVAERVNRPPLGLLFLDARAAGASAQALQGMAPAETVLMLGPRDLMDGIDLSAAQSLRERGFGLALCDACLGFLESNVRLLAHLSYVQLGLSHPDLVAISRLVKHSQPQASVLVEQFSDWREFDLCTPLRLNGFFNDICLIPRKPGPPGELGPQSVLILQLM